VAAVFWINVPAVCLTLAACAVLVPNLREPAAPPLDVGRSAVHRVTCRMGSSTARNTAGQRNHVDAC
jgi:hypothetical protein